MHVTSATHSSSFIASKARAESSATLRQFQTYAVGMIAEYLSEENEKRLREHLG